ncbi:MAG: methylated-DNA--[protein]-cysteine S-methyltransferase [Leucobacter sp.]
MNSTRSATVQTINTPDGDFTIIADEHGNVLASGWTVDRQALSRRIHLRLRPAETVEGATRAAKAVNAYYAGDTDAITAIPVLQLGSELQQRGWAALRAIHAGQPANYTEFATLIGSPAAVRAAASICARNAAGLFVPCHRVVRTDGALGGFAWGTAVKQSLLDRESQV